ncbi:MAG: mechanosensitive ion channel [Rubrivivax sp.]|jgi:small-conductance mechanosensitive channel|nr:mechanosensitive ion channel [Rubrivivax sp.]
MTSLPRPATVPEDFGALVAALTQRTVLIEAALLAAGLLLAFGIVRAIRGPAGRAETTSIWFGIRIVDGVLFPVLALGLALLTRWLLRHYVPAVPVALFKLVVPMLVSLAVIRLTVQVLHSAFPSSQLMRVVERSVSWLAWIAVVLWITGLLPLLLTELDAITWKVGSTSISVRNLIEGVIAAAAVLVGVLWLSAAIESRLLKGAQGAGESLSLRKMGANAVRALLLFVGLMLALSAAGIDLTALGVLGGAVGVGIGLGLQKLAANYVSGFVILAERSMRIGDMVRVDNFEGRITDITTRYTVIRALNGRESIVPNEMMIVQRVENNSLADPRVALTTVVQVAYGSDLPRLIPLLTDAVRQVPRVIADPGPAVLLTAFAADGLELTVNFWIADSENGAVNARSAVNLALLAALQREGVEIPFPQRVLHGPAPATLVPPLNGDAARSPHPSTP